MADVTDLFEVKGDDIVLNVHVQPAAGRSAVVGRHGDALKVRVAAPPVEGRANAATVEVLAETLGVKAASVELTSGESSRQKRFLVRGVEAEDVEQRLKIALAEANRKPERPSHQ
jgi:uncharacterized protein (TIGR00251 family)